MYRRRFLQVNTRWKALAEIYTMHSFAPFFNLKISAKNRQHFFAIESLNFRFFHFLRRILHFFCEFLMIFFPDFAPNSRKEWRLSLFNQFCEKKLENCRKFWNLWKLFNITKYSILFIRVRKHQRKEGTDQKAVFLSDIMQNRKSSFAY